jgi:hypothetical protein
MFGVPIKGPVNTFCDNSSVVRNATHPASTLKKKHNAIASIAAKVIQVSCLHTSKNCADLLMKPLLGPALHPLCEKVLYLCKDPTEVPSE